MAIALVAHTTAGSSNATNVTSSAIDTTGANFIIVYSSADGVNNPVTDNKGNTYTQIPGGNGTNPAACAVNYVFNPTVGAGHTFSVIAGAPAICVAAFSGVASYDGTVTASTLGSTSTIQTAAIAPIGGEVLIAAVGNFIVGGTFSIDSSFSITDQITSAAALHYGAAMAWVTAPNTTPIQPTWTFSGAATLGAGAALTGVLSAAVAVTRSVSDTISLSDAVVRSFINVLSFSDTITLSDFVVLPIVTFGDTLSILDDSLISITFGGGPFFIPPDVLTDTLNLTDGVDFSSVQTVFPPNPNILVDDSLSLSDSLDTTSPNQSPQSDFIALTDDIALTFSRFQLVSDTISLSDGSLPSPQLLLLDGISLSDGLSFLLSSIQPSAEAFAVGDTLHLTDGLAFIKPPTGVQVCSRYVLSDQVWVLLRSTRDGYLRRYLNDVSLDNPNAVAVSGDAAFANWDQVVNVDVITNVDTLTI